MSKRTYNKRIIRETPPPRTRRGRPPVNQNFLARVAKEAAGEWVVFDRKAKSTSVINGLARHPNWKGKLEHTTRRNSDGTYGVWVRIWPNGIPQS